MYITLLGQTEGPTSNYTPLAISTPSTWILVSDTILQLKEPELLGEMPDSRAGTGNIKEGETEVFCSARK